MTTPPRDHIWLTKALRCHLPISPGWLGATHAFAALLIARLISMSDKIKILFELISIHFEFSIILFKEKAISTFNDYCGETVALATMLG